MIAPRTVAGMPDWVKRTLLGEALWKWFALTLLLSRWRSV
jgi:hypothetical protein